MINLISVYSCFTYVSTKEVGIEAAEDIIFTMLCYTKYCKCNFRKP